jgi:hypothetical protein
MSVSVYFIPVHAHMHMPMHIPMLQKMDFHWDTDTEWTGATHRYGHWHSLRHGHSCLFPRHLFKDLDVGYQI